MTIETKEAKQIYHVLGIVTFLASPTGLRLSAEWRGARAAPLGVARMWPRERASANERDTTSHVRGLFLSRVSREMSGTVSITSTSMYPVRSAVVLPAQCPHSGSMYEIRSIYEDRRDDRRRCHATTAAVADSDIATEAKMPDDVVTQASLPEYGALEVRQEKILNQLAELKKQVSRLCYFLKQSEVFLKQSKMEVTHDFVAVQKPIVVRLVLHVNPSKPPYSLLALQKLWKDVNLRVMSHIHSTVRDQIPLVFPQIPEHSDTVNTIDLTLIWNEVSDMEMITKCAFPIKGEANFLRYVSRLMESHNYESTCLQPHTLDFALDFVNLLHNEQCIEKGLLVLAQEFEKWSCKGGFNIADIAVWSLIKQFPGINIPQSLRKWYTLCETTFTEELINKL